MLVPVRVRVKAVLVLERRLDGCRWVQRSMQICIDRRHGDKMHLHTKSTSTTGHFGSRAYGQMVD